MVSSPVLGGVTQLLVPTFVFASNSCGVSRKPHTARVIEPPPGYDDDDLDYDETDEELGLRRPGFVPVQWGDRRFVREEQEGEEGSDSNIELSDRESTSASEGPGHSSVLAVTDSLPQKPKPRFHTPEPTQSIQWSSPIVHKVDKPQSGTRGGVEEYKHTLRQLYGDPQVCGILDDQTRSNPKGVWSECWNCGQVFESVNGRWKMHMDNHRVRYECTGCGVQFAQGSKHTPEQCGKVEKRIRPDPKDRRVKGMSPTETLEAYHIRRGYVRPPHLRLAEILHNPNNFAYQPRIVPFNPRPYGREQERL